MDLRVSRRKPKEDPHLDPTQPDSIKYSQFGVDQKKEHSQCCYESAKPIVILKDEVRAHGGTCPVVVIAPLECSLLNPGTQWWVVYIPIETRSAR